MTLNAIFLTPRRLVRNALLALVGSVSLFATSHAFTPSDQPPTTISVPGNVALALSVEFPTGLQISYANGGASYAFNTSVPLRYQGYFDNRKCYSYSNPNEVFVPVSALKSAGDCPASNQWSGDVLNWLTMTNIDQFRSVMTGGTRDSFSSMSGASPGDTVNQTILIRSLSDRNNQSNNPIKQLPASGFGVPPSQAGSWVSSTGYGSKFIASPYYGFPGDDYGNSCANMNFGGGNSCFNIRVQVCTAIAPTVAEPAGVPLEANCKTQYTGTPKPEGLIQQYAVKMRFAALAYLNDSNQGRDGAVLRSAMKSVGPTATTATTTSANVAKEWDEATGIIFNNPDPADASASGVVNSGLINYLNKFGYTSGYKTYDNVSELYYATQLYLRGEAPPPQYADVGNDPYWAAVYKDGFPVITGASLQAGGARDPIISSCQKNFILGIGDINTWCDGNLPGSVAGLCSPGLPSDPAGLNVQNLWSTVSALEGSGGAWTGGAGAATPYMAGLAHWANTNDIRLQSNMPGKQTISTYWVDVLEYYTGTTLAAGQIKSQYWYAAKYGGFNPAVAGGNDPNSNVASWDANGDGAPDNWFAGNSPSSMRQGLSSAFSAIAAASGSSAAGSAATSSQRQTAGGLNFKATYATKDWSGGLSSCSPSQTDAQCESTPSWEASNWFKTTLPTLVPTPLTPTTRKIFTSSTLAGFTKTPFLWASLSPAQKSILDATDSRGQYRVDYLRGDRTNETTFFRPRKDTLLGDIVNSGVAYVAGSGPVYSGPYFPGHGAYRTTNRARPAVVYAGANDGMLHAFSGANGKELFAYIPGAVFDKLPGLTNPTFLHKYFVDSTPMSGDVQSGATWKTMLVGGLGAGGKGYYALDITGQATFAGASEAALSALPMWEFTSAQDTDLGFTYNQPSLDAFRANSQIAKVANNNATTKGVWRVIVGNGYGSTAGKSALFMLDALTGTSAIKLVADNGPLNGLSTPTAVDTDGDGLVDTIYAGDLLGKLHKFQFSKTVSGNYKVADAGDTTAAWRYLGVVFNSGQPITTAPSVGPACIGLGQTVSFGTGKWNEDADFADQTSVSGFYSVADNRPSSALTVPLTDLALVPYSSVVVISRNERNFSAPNLTGKSGWYFTFTAGERILSNSIMPPDTGNVAWATTKPIGGACSAGNSGFTMSANMCTGAMDSLMIDGIRVGGYQSFLGDGVNMISPTIRLSNGNEAIVSNQGNPTGGGGGPTTCTGPGCPPCTGPNCPGNGGTLSTNAAPKGRYSWREILTK